MNHRVPKTTALMKIMLTLNNRRERSEKAKDKQQVVTKRMSLRF